MYSIGFLGFGNMAKAIFAGIDRFFSDLQINIFDIDNAQIDINKYNICKNANELCEFSDIIFICVKPNVVPTLCKEIDIDDKAYVSIAAGITQKYLVENLPSKSRVARIMPNTPLLIGEGMVCIQSPNTLKNTEEDFIVQLFSKLGKVIKINGNYMDVVTGISGSGPAYVYLFIELMIKSGMKNGLTYTTSLELVLQTFRGACAMVSETHKEPKQLIKDVCSPNGTTLAAMEVLQSYEISDIIDKAVNAAILRSEELSK